MKYDVFISHAGEDKDDVARPLAQELERRGLRVWYDEAVLTIGDNLRRSIDRGLLESRFGVVILSRTFLQKEWPNRELDGLVGRDDGSVKVILPVWHGVSRADIARYSPTLADKLAVSTSLGITRVADEIVRAIATGEPSVVVASPVIDPISSIRAMMLASPGRHELRRCRYEVEEYLGRHPHDAEARLLLDAIIQALRYEEAPKDLSAPRLPSATRVRMSPIPVAVLILFVTAIGFYGVMRALRPSPTSDVRTKSSEIERAASLEGDRYSLQLATTDTLRIVLTWEGSNDVDLGVQAPGTPPTWYGTPGTPTPLTTFDRDVRVRRGEIMATMNAPAAGAYELVVHNHSGQSPVEYRLSVVVSGTTRQVFVGTLNSPNQRYTLELQVVK